MKKYIKCADLSILDSYILVKHRLDSGEETPSDGSSSWKDFWEKQTEKLFGLCACEGCSEPATDGAHVIKADGSDKSWYIVPMCHQCNTNKKREPFRVKEVLLVPVAGE